MSAGNKAKARAIVEQVIKNGTKMPGMLEIPKALGIKRELEACNDVDSLITKLQSKESVIKKMFGISDNKFDEGIDKLKELKG